MYCTNCGHHVEANDPFCYQCGHALSFPETSKSIGGAWRSLPVPWRGGEVALGMLLILISIFPVAGLAVGLGKLAGRLEVAVGAWESSHLMGFAILLVVWYLGLRPHGVTLSSLGLTLPTASWVKCILLTAGVLGASLIGTIGYSGLVNLAGLEILLPPDIPADIVFPGPAAVFTYQALALWTPFTEEIFFRGFVFAGLVPRFGLKRAMIASALIFSAFHLSSFAIGLIVPIFITGLLLAWLYSKTGSLWTSIAAHAGQNALAIAVTSLWG